MKIISSPHRAFSLIEVVLAVGVFAFVAVAVIGMLSPITRSVSDVAETDDATKVVSALQTGLQAEVRRVGWTNFATYLTGSTELYASRDGTSVGLGSDTAVWDQDNPANGVQAEENGRKFFAISLTRNTVLSPSAGDGNSGFLAFNVRLAWPAYQPNGLPITDGDPTTSTEAETQQSVMVVPFVITR
jgi:type II secretory pathway pseudopilin PulG